MIRGTTICTCSGGSSLVVNFLTILRSQTKNYYIDCMYLSNSVQNMLIVYAMLQLLHILIMLVIATTLKP